MRKAAKDFLDEIVDEETVRTPAFPAMVDAATERRRLASELARAREERHLSQAAIATRMSTAQSVISKLEAGEDVKLSTLVRCGGALGLRLVWAPAPARRRRRGR